MTMYAELEPGGDGALGRVYSVTLEVNGRVERIEARADATLLQVLRDRFDLFGVREGCGVGMCGACTVLVDGTAVNSCLVLAPVADGWRVTTVEGLGGRQVGTLDPLQQAFIDRTAFQCSYCTPGFLLVARALLDENPDATDGEIQEAIAGNLCRCGSYSRIREAIALARDAGKAGGR